MKHYTEFIPNLPFELELAGIQIKNKYKLYNHMVESLNILKESIERESVLIDKQILALIGEVAFSGAIEKDTCDFKTIDD